MQELARSNKTADARKQNSPALPKMMSRKLVEETREAGFRDVPDHFKISNYGYGKDSVKVMHVVRNGLVHSIKEFEVGTKLKLSSQKDYLQGMCGLLG